MPAVAVCTTLHNGNISIIVHRTALLKAIMVNNNRVYFVSAERRRETSPPRSRHCRWPARLWRAASPTARPSRGSADRDRLREWGRVRGASGTGSRLTSEGAPRGTDRSRRELERRTPHHLSAGTGPAAFDRGVAPRDGRVSHTSCVKHHPDGEGKPCGC